MNGVDLCYSKLNDANLHYAELNGVGLCYAKLNNANLHYAELNGTDLTGAKLDGANLCDAKLDGADLSYAELNDADLTIAGLNGADLTGAELNDADLTGAGLNGADLTGAELNGADLHSASLNNSNLSNAKINEKTNLSHASMCYVSMNDSYITETKSIRTAKELFDVHNKNCDRIECSTRYIIDKVIDSNNEKDYIAVNKDQFKSCKSYDCNKKYYYQYNKFIDLLSDGKAFQCDGKWILSKKDFEYIEKKLDMKLEYTDVTRSDLIKFRKQSLHVYSQLYDFYSKEGREKEECDLNYLKNEARRKLYWANHDYATSLGYLCTKYSCKYGNSFLRVALTSAAIISIFTAFYFMIGTNGGIYYDDPAAVSSVWFPDLFFDALFLSVTAFTNLGFSLIQPDVRTLSTEIAVIIESILGLVIIAMLVYTLTRKISK